MGQPTLNAWEICSAVFLISRAVRPDGLALRWRGKRLPTASGLAKQSFEEVPCYVCRGLPRCAAPQAQGASPVVRRPVWSAAAARPRQREDETKPRDWGGTVQHNRFPSIINKVSYSEYIGIRSERRELKHLSTCRKGHQPRLRK
jgi:hypothetical protein